MTESPVPAHMEKWLLMALTVKVRLLRTWDKWNGGEGVGGEVGLCVYVCVCVCEYLNMSCCFYIHLNYRCVWANMLFPFFSTLQCISVLKGGHSSLAKFNPFHK